MFLPTLSPYLLEPLGYSYPASAAQAHALDITGPNVAALGVLARKTWQDEGQRGAA